MVLLTAFALTSLAVAERACAGENSSRGRGGSKDASPAPRQMEWLDRGLVAVRVDADRVFVGWRLLATDPAHVAFNVYRDARQCNARPLAAATMFTDEAREDGQYTVRAVINGREEPASGPVGVWRQNILKIPLQRPDDGYHPNDTAPGDLTGDGQYELVVKWDKDGKDNSHAGHTSSVYLDAYTLAGVRLWRINLGPNIRAGAHYTQFLVYDFDGDGRAEIVCKTADGTVDGQGVVIGDPEADYRNESGYVLAGPEFLTVFDGRTGAAIATTDYIPPRSANTLTPSADEIKKDGADPDN